MPQYDVIVVGLGAIGSATLRVLARRGVKVLGIERFALGHDRGSSHGETRMIRLGYFEHPSYVPLLRRTYALWRELEAEAGHKLLHITGIAEMGLPDSDVVAGTLAASQLHDLPHEVLSAKHAMARFPAFRLPDDFVCVVQPDGGFVAVEAAMTAMVDQAKAAGAEIWSETMVQALTPTGRGVRVATSRGDVEAASAIIAAGPWISRLAPDLPLRVTRQVMTWFEPREPALLELGRFPVFLMRTPHGNHYGFPSVDGSLVKIAKHHHLDETVDAETVDRAVSLQDEAAVRAAVAAHIPAADGPIARAKTCLYTVTPDHDFIIDLLPGAPSVTVASACSGHGFKFAPVMGEILADLAISRRTAHDIGRFRLSRFGC
ncbi:N-methyl-L-tryptophan oxidase [Rhodoplanes sp. Z2-YC6860]|uniref:N-methyl-L-tryptophan oxidase n=1 Tax=Rhodoplanes sp. Z2-YC6860 TaxID=674703 RepID=UPI00078C8041|nr:N-methyl-L-tryptophan oxidase [Rhodoplanes sp. Z2-YC6860]AMN41054.1 N-methyltryptophan oxidase [Rhodoplanes sp. Z2-YC6860]